MKHRVAYCLGHLPGRNSDRTRDVGMRDENARCVRSLRSRSSQNQIGHTQRQIDSDQAFDRQRLQDYGSSGATDQQLGAQTESESNVAAGANVAASQRSLADSAIARKNAPEQHSAPGDADIKAQPSNKAPVDIAPTGSRKKNAPHILA